jgi:hypothetical protein
MEIYLNWSDFFTCSIEHNIEINLPNFVLYTLKICRVVCLIEEWWLANTTSHVAFVDFESIREGKSLTSSDTN